MSSASSKRSPAAPSAKSTVISSGNAVNEGAEHRCWFAGSFMSQDNLLRNENFELKWKEHRKGEHKEKPASESSVPVSTLSILVRGRIRVSFPSQKKTVTLCKEGDYVLWKPNIAHVLDVDEDSLLLSVRWPSAAKTAAKNKDNKKSA